MEFFRDDPRGAAAHTTDSEHFESFANCPSEARFATRLVRAVARRLVGKAGITYDELPDLQQDIWLDLLERLPNYQLDRGYLRGFITRVIKNKVASILKARAAATRGGGLQFVSMDEDLEDEDGETSNLHETLGVDDYLRRTRGTIRTEEERQDLALDVRRMVEGLPAHQRVVCMLLIDRNACDVANVVGIPRSTLRDLLKKLRRTYTKTGSRKYFE